MSLIDIPTESIATDRLLVILDGTLIGCVIEADAEKGYVIQSIYDGGARILLTRKGNVKIVFNGREVVRMEVRLNQ